LVTFSITAVAGFGLGGLIYKLLIGYLIELSGVSSTFLYLGIIYLLLVIVGAQLLKNPTEEQVLKYQSKQQTSNSEVKTIVDASNQFTPKQMLRTQQFYLLWFMFLFVSVSGLMVISFAVDIFWLGWLKYQS
jgi:MFS transporter, OFA family, oxalate/formate antiporter